MLDFLPSSSIDLAGNSGEVINKYVGCELLQAYLWLLLHPEDGLGSDVRGARPRIYVVLPNKGHY